jgi:hypothetical protein
MGNQEDEGNSKRTHGNIHICMHGGHTGMHAAHGKIRRQQKQHMGGAGLGTQDICCSIWVGLDLAHMTYAAAQGWGWTRHTGHMLQHMGGLDSAHRIYAAAYGKIRRQQKQHMGGAGLGAQDICCSIWVGWTRRTGHMLQHCFTMASGLNPLC